jgi:aminopeptidase YwaD
LPARVAPATMRVVKLHDYSRDFIGRCMTEHDAFGFLRSLCEGIGPRLSGSDGEARATEALLARFAECGYETKNEPVPYAGWRAGPSRVVARMGGAPAEMPSFPLGWCPGASIEGRIVDAGCGTPEELRSRSVRGAIALVSSETPPGGKPMHRSEKYALAVDAGATGFLFYDRRPGGLPAMGTACLEPRLGSIPAAGICYEDAMRLREGRDRTSGTISSTSSGEDVVSHNGIGLKRGTDAGEIVVCGHIDTWFSPGAVDNGSGIAMVAELARLLAPCRLRRSVRFVSFGSEELGLLGSKHHVASRGDLSGIACVLNLDCSAIRDGSPGVMTNDNPGLHAFMTGIAAELRIPLGLNPDTLRHSDNYPFTERGVPAASFSASGGSYGFAHTACDTLDKLCPEAFTLPLIVTGVTLIESAMQDISFRPPR